jgi:hypothetical protein
MAGSRRKRRQPPPTEGYPIDARYWLYVFDGIDRGIRVGWTKARARGLGWLKEHAPGGWLYDTRRRVKYDARGRQVA